MDILHKALQWVDYHRGVVFGVVIALLVSGWLVSCQPKTGSLIDDQNVTAREFEAEFIVVEAGINKRIADYNAQGETLQAEINSINERAELGRDDILEQIKFRQQITQMGGGLIVNALAGQPINAADTAGSIINLLMTGGLVGMGVDVVRKNKRLRDIKNGAA